MSATGSKPNGFTLLEMLVVLAIAALASGLVFPQLDRGLRLLSLRQTSVALRADLGRTRADAILWGRPQSLSIDPAGEVYYAKGRPHPAPRGVGISASSSALVFFADGSSLGGEVVVKTKGVATALHIDPVSGGIWSEDLR